MTKKKPKKNELNFFEKFSKFATYATGTPTAFNLALLIILIWIACGPFFNYSDTWQLIINTSTTIVTFLMVFLIQQSQNKDILAQHLKLNELIAVSKEASNRLIDVEDLNDKELKIIRDFYVKLAALARDHHDVASSHSLNEAENLHSKKSQKK